MIDKRSRVAQVYFRLCDVEVSGAGGLRAAAALAWSSIARSTGSIVVSRVRAGTPDNRQAQYLDIVGVC